MDLSQLPGAGALEEWVEVAASLPFYEMQNCTPE